VRGHEVDLKRPWRRVKLVDSLAEHDLWTRDVWDSKLLAKLMSGWGDLGGLATGDAELAAARAATRMTTLLRAQLAPMQDTDPYGSAPVAYPAGGNPFPRRLAGGHGSKKDGQRIAGGDIHLLSFHRERQHALQSIDRLVELLVVVRHRHLRAGGNRELKYRHGAVRVGRLGQKLDRNLPHSDGFFAHK